MKLSALEGIIPNRRACFDLLVLLENEYNVSLNMWLDANNPRGGEIGWTVYVVGSGHIYDLDSATGILGEARVLDADGGNIYRAIWSALRSLESKLHRAVQVASSPALP